MVKEAPFRIFGQRLLWCQGAGHTLTLRKSILRRGNSMYKGSEAEMSLVCWRNSRKIIVAEIEQDQPVGEISQSGRQGPDQDGTCSKGDELGFSSECDGFGAGK